MSARTTQKAETAHGTIEYQTVTCDSCGNEMLEDDAEPFTIGDRRGVACPHCVDEGPVSFPEKAKEKLIQGPGTDPVDDGFLRTLAIGWLALPICLLITVFDGESAPDFTQGMGWATAYMVIYASIAYGAWMFL